MTNDQPPAIKLWLRLFLPFAAGYFFSYFLRNANAVIAPELTRELGLSAADLGVLTGAYLASFAAAQVPLGIALDRFGPRRVEATLLLFAALGCGVFAASAGVAGLTLGRGLIGLGVSACLMGSFATFARWFDPTRQASLNGAIMAAGAAGALAATAPVLTLVEWLGWRGMFAAFAGVGVLLSLGIWTTPERRVPGSGARLGEQLRDVGRIAVSRTYWVFAPQAMFMIGGFMALQSLWAVPFLIEADGLTRAAAAQHMLLSATGMLVGFLTIALGAQWLAQRMALETVLGIGVGLAVAAQAAIAVGLDVGGLLWLMLGMCYGASNLSYALLQKRFALHLAGRVNTTLNLLAFVGAFAIQWGFGVAIDAMLAAGMAKPQAFRWAMGALTTAMAAGWAWYVLNVRRLDATAH